MKGVEVVKACEVYVLTHTGELTMVQKGRLLDMGRGL